MQRWLANKKHWMLLLLAAAGTFLMVVGLQQPKGKEPDNWTRLDAALQTSIPAPTQTEKVTNAQEKQSDENNKENDKPSNQGTANVDTTDVDTTDVSTTDVSTTDVSTTNEKASENATVTIQQCQAGQAAPAEVKSTNTEGATTEEASSHTSDTPSTAVNMAPVSSVSDSSTAWSSDGRLNINQATAEQLQELPGIGPAKAKAIVAERESGGAFKTVDDLLRVKGIGSKMLAKMKDLVVAGS